MEGLDPCSGRNGPSRRSVHQRRPRHAQRPVTTSIACRARWSWRGEVELAGHADDLRRGDAPRAGSLAAGGTHGTQATRAGRPRECRRRSGYSRAIAIKAHLRSEPGRHRRLLPGDSPRPASPPRHGAGPARRRPVPREAELPHATKPARVGFMATNPGSSCTRRSQDRTFSNGSRVTPPSGACAT